MSNNTNDYIDSLDISKVKELLGEAGISCKGKNNDLVDKLKSHCIGNPKFLKIPDGKEDEKISKKIVWEWCDEGGWAPYDEETNEMIEKAYQEGKTLIKLTHGVFANGGYRINIQKLYQQNRKTAYKRNIRRVTIPTEPSSDEEEDELKDESHTSCEENDTDNDLEPTWEWHGDSKWHVYDPQTIKIIETAYSSGNDSVELSHSFFGSQGGYIIDFKKMSQIKKATGYVRTIKRNPPATAHLKIQLPVFIEPLLQSQHPISQLGFPFQVDNQGEILSPFMQLGPFTHKPQMAVCYPHQEKPISWEYQQTDGTWIAYDKSACRMIEGMRTHGTHIIMLSHGEFAKNHCVIDLKNKKHTETGTGNVSNIRRNPPLDDCKEKEKEEVPRPKKKRKLVEESKGEVFDMEDKIDEFAKLTKWKSYEPKPTERCAICFEEYDPEQKVILLPCNHHYCLNCIIQCYRHGFLLCPMCKTCYGTMVGTMPDGTFKFMEYPPGAIPLSGHETDGTIVISISFPRGTQGPDHPNPGQPYYGTNRKAYLPATPEGRELLQLFKIAWDRKLLFRIGTSVTTGAEDQVVWNGIHMKTNTTGGPTNFGFPDNGYAARVKQELAAKGITLH